MEFLGKRILVYGAGKSGLAALELLKKKGAEPFIFDDKTDVFPDHPEDLDMAVLSPGVPVDLPNVLALKAAGVPVIGEVELAYRAGKGTVLAITGTNGKTTTTALLGHILRAWKDSVFVVGNIGTAYTSAALDMTDESYIAAEISSFQLETTVDFHPAVTAILNITEDHLNRHYTMENYAAVKESIAKNQTKDEVCVLNYEDDYLRPYAEICPARPVFFSSARQLENGYYLDGKNIVKAENGEAAVLISTDEVTLIGTHNFENIMAAWAMAEAAGVPSETIKKAVMTFTAVPHRIEYVGTKKGVVWYNDSKGTNPDAAIKGIEAMKWPTFLIGGGYDKGSDYKPWIRAFGGRVKALLLEGKTKEDIKAAALSCGFPEEKIFLFENMTEAMAYAADHAEEGDAVLLSPACASWGEFPNYEVRGDKFREFFEEL